MPRRADGLYRRMGAQSGKCPQKPDVDGLSDHGKRVTRQVPSTQSVLGRRVKVLVRNIIHLTPLCVQVSNIYFVLSARKMTLLKANLGVACPSSALALMEDGAKS